MQRKEVSQLIELQEGVKNKNNKNKIGKIDKIYTPSKALKTQDF